MRKTVLSLGGLALFLTASAAVADTPAKRAYGPQMEPAMFEPGRDAPEQLPKYRPFFEPQKTYERAVQDWKDRQYRCMKKGSLCFETKPLPSDLLETPRAR